MIRESKRKNPVYRQEALATLGEFVELRASKDLFPHVLEITTPIITDALDESTEMDVDSVSRDISSQSLYVLLLRDFEP